MPLLTSQLTRHQKRVRLLCSLLRSFLVMVGMIEPLHIWLPADITPGNGLCNGGTEGYG